MIARMLGPGLAHMTKYADQVSSRLEEKRVSEDMTRARTIAAGKQSS
jgi:hypothetical protein